MDYTKLLEVYNADNGDKTAVVVLSGGQDSVTCLGLALRNFKEVHAVGFDYNQKHSVELQCAAKVCKGYGVPFQVFTIPALATLNDSALIRGGDTNVNAEHPSNSNLPASFVPNRNALFLTTAHAVAQKVGASAIITGVCETDFSGYPDCRQVFITALESTLNIGYATDIRIMTPLMALDKAETFKLAEDVDFLDAVLNDSHTCYNGNHSESDRHDWGYGCGQCPACELRAKGWNTFLEGVKDIDYGQTDSTGA